MYSLLIPTVKPANTTQLHIDFMNYHNLCFLKKDIGQLTSEQQSYIKSTNFQTRYVKTYINNINIWKDQDACHFFNSILAIIFKDIELINLNHKESLKILSEKIKK